ncbi:MAG: ABC transporter substrate-binding protein [Sulfuriflexus sp.]|nr:ABC transporter substrate-binding protein [Sulfuriflexus sp.]
MNTTQTKHMPNHSRNKAQRISMFLVLTAAVIMLAFASMATANEKQAADQIISETTSRMLAALKQEQDIITQHPARIHELANTIIMPHVDFQRMSSWVLGKHWRRATAEQKQLFPAQFRSLILRTYATALSEYTDESIRYLPLRASEDATDVTVKTIIERNTGPGIPVAYRMHQTQQGWKVYDISIDGISLVNNYRRSFSSEIRRNGLDNLINKLTAKNNRLAAKHSQLASNQ